MHMKIIAEKIDVRTNAIRPPHEVDRPKQYEAIKSSMEKRGWRGRRVLAVASGDGFDALTGSHRIRAAKDVGLETIPALVLNFAFTDREMKLYNERGEYPAKYRALEGAGLIDISKQAWGIPSDDAMPDVLREIGAPRSAVRLAEDEIAHATDRGDES
jgi:hypothetical protein